MFQDIYRKLWEVKLSLGLDLDVMQSYTEVVVVAVNDASLRVGKGRGEMGEVDVPILRDSHGIPYIPGSSLKGVLRSTLESLYAHNGCCYVGTPDNECCSLRTELTYIVIDRLRVKLFGRDRASEALREVAETLRSSRNSIASRYRRCPVAENEVEAVAKLLEDIASSDDVLKLKYVLPKPCIVCRIFGNKALASHVYVSDAYPEKRDVKSLIRTRVAIDRFTQAALPRALFDYEFIPPGYRWIFKIAMWNIDLEAKNDVSEAMKKILKIMNSHGVFVGGMKSVGYGLLRIVAEDSKVKMCKVQNGDLVCSEKSLTNVLQV